MNNAQLHQQQQSLMQQMAMLTTNATTQRNTAHVRPPAQIYTPPPLHSLQQQQPYYPPRGGGRGGGRNFCGCGQHGRGSGLVTQQMLSPIPYVGGNNIIPYIPAGAQPPPRQCNPDYSNIVKIRMYASHADLMWKIGTRVPPAIAKKQVIRMIHLL
jgi:hypothetical protein